MSLLKTALREQNFVCVMEFVPKPSAERFAAMEAIMARAHLCGWPMTVAIGDRVGSPLDMSPLDALASFSNPVPALPHFPARTASVTTCLPNCSAWTPRASTSCCC